MIKYKLEKWNSDSGNREDHYFRDGKILRYFFGYNPKLVSPDQIKKIKKILGLTKTDLTKVDLTKDGTSI